MEVWGETADGVGKPSYGGARKEGAGRAGARSCKRSRGCADLCPQAGSCPLLWICSLATGAAKPGQFHAAASWVRSVSTAQGRGPGREAAPRQGSSLQSMGWPRSCHPCASGCCVRGCGDAPMGCGAQPGLATASVGSRDGNRAVPALGPFPTPGWGRSAPRAAVLWKEKVAGRGGPARELRGHFGAGCELVTGSWEPEPPSPLHRGMLCTAGTWWLVPTIPTTHRQLPPSPRANFCAEG